MVLQQEAVAAGLDFELRCLRNFDEAVDAMFMALDAVGDGERLVELCPFFGKLWPSARALAAEVAVGGATTMVGRSVIELGCGLGLPSMVAARLGAEVLATDFHPDVEPFLRDNLRRNGLDVGFATLDWQNVEAVEAAAERCRYDLVMGSDVLYDRAHAPALVHAIARLTAEGGTVLLTDPGRAYLQDFVSLMTAAGFESTLSARKVKSEDASAKEIYLLRFMAPSAVGSVAGGKRFF